MWSSYSNKGKRHWIASTNKLTQNNADQSKKCLVFYEAFLSNKITECYGKPGSLVTEKLPL